MTVFAYGFRTFFLLAALASPLALACWLAFLFLGHRPPGSLDPLLWHAHEMLFGFVGAMVAGFLLTAVPNWTGRPAPKGRPLVWLGLLWLAGRLAILGPSPQLAALVDLAFLPGLYLLILPPLIRHGEAKQRLFLPILLAFWAANGLVHLQAMGLASTAHWGLSLAVTVIVLLMTIIAGRVLPFFTQAALGSVPRRSAPLDAFCILLVALMPLMDHLSPPSALVAGWALSASLAHGIRLVGWYDRRIWRVPLLWILHLGYAWIAVGFVLRGGAALNWWAQAPSLHAFTAGAMGSLGLGIMARAALGHTGRPLQPARLTVGAFAMLQAAALLRVMGPLIEMPRVWAYAAPGLMWCGAFLLYLWVYLPILTSPRVDGKPG